MGAINLSKSWLKFLNSEFDTERMAELKKFLAQELKNKKVIYPATENYFRALNLVPLENVKIVILGQDPYHGPKEAHGLSFSVPEGEKYPPSLQNIFKEIKTDIGRDIPLTGDLTRWANQGVLLLNSVLTVEENMAASHQKKGWEEFTDKIIQVVNENCNHVVFILWGSYAQKKAEFVDQGRHLVLKSAHPSPLSSYRGFFGSRPFSKSNQWLISKGLKPIEW